MMSAQKVSQHFLYLSQNQQEMSAIFSVVTFECSTCYCITVEQYTLSRNHRASSKWCDMAMCVLNNRLLKNFLWQNNEDLQAVKKCIWYQCS